EGGLETLALIETSSRPTRDPLASAGIRPTARLATQRRLASSVSEGRRRDPGIESPRTYNPTLRFVPTSGPGRYAMTASRLRRLQARKLRSLLRTIRDSNAFYRRKLEDAALDPKELDERIADPEADPRTLLSRLPFTEKQELLEDQAASPPYGTNL